MARNTTITAKLSIKADHAMHHDNTITTTITFLVAAVDSVDAVDVVVVVDAFRE